MLTPTGHITPFYALWLPLILAIGVAIADNTLPHLWVNFVYSENGFLETLQPIAAFAAVYVGISTLRTPGLSKWIKAWLILGVLGCLYIGLEEISYGQQLLQWETGEFWASINDQNETNWHNTSSWLDQKPRNVLMIGIIVGGLLIPLFERYKPSLLPQQFNDIYPRRDLMAVAALMLFSYLTKVIYKLSGFMIYDRPSELNETYMYYFVLLYLVQFRWQVRNKQTPADHG